MLNIIIIISIIIIIDHSWTQTEWTRGQWGTSFAPSAAPSVADQRR